MELTRFDPPGFLDDFDDTQRAAWSTWISRQMDRAAAGRPDVLDFDGPREQFFNPLKKPIGDDAHTADIAWTAFPRNVQLQSVSDVQRWRTADGSRDVQDEYCEWSVERNVAGKITRVTFTCEGPEYWEFLGATAPARVLELYQRFIHPDVQHSDLFLPNGRYNARNRWNSGTQQGAMHLIQVNNSLSAEIELAGGSSVVRVIGGRTLTEAQELIECGRYGGAERNSDPHIGAVVNSLTRQKADVTLANPVGLYFAGLSTAGWEAPDGSDPALGWRYLRGREGTPVRAVYEFPADHPFTVGDVRINGRPVEFGAQIADFIQIKLTGLATRVGQSTIQPMTGCRAPKKKPDLELESLATTDVLSVSDVLESMLVTTR